MFGETRKQPSGLADLLLWFGLVDDGIVMQRDGSLLAAWQYRGPDLQSATHAEMAAVAKRAICSDPEAFHAPDSWSKISHSVKAKPA